MNWSIHMKTLNGRLVTSPNRQSSLHAVIIIIIIIIIVTGMRHPLHFHDEKKDNETENRRNSTRDSHSNCKVSFEKDGALSLSLSLCVCLFVLNIGDDKEWIFSSLFGFESHGPTGTETPTPFSSCHSSCRSDLKQGTIRCDGMPTGTNERCTNSREFRCVANHEETPTQTGKTCHRGLVQDKARQTFTSPTVSRQETTVVLSRLAKTSAVSSAKSRYWDCRYCWSWSCCRYCCCCCRCRCSWSCYFCHYHHRLCDSLIGLRSVDSSWPPILIDSQFDHPTRAQSKHTPTHTHTRTRPQYYYYYHNSSSS